MRTSCDATDFSAEIKRQELKKFPDRDTYTYRVRLDSCLRVLPGTYSVLELGHDETEVFECVLFVGLMLLRGL